MYCNLDTDNVTYPRIFVKNYNIVGYKGTIQYYFYNFVEKK